MSKNGVLKLSEHLKNGPPIKNLFSCSLSPRSLSVACRVYLPYTQNIYVYSSSIVGISNWKSFDIFIAHQFLPLCACECLPQVFVLICYCGLSIWCLKMVEMVEVGAMVKWKVIGYSPGLWQVTLAMIFMTLLQICHSCAKVSHQIENLESNKINILNHK